MKHIYAFHHQIDLIQIIQGSWEIQGTSLQNNTIHTSKVQSQIHKIHMSNNNTTIPKHNPPP